MSDEKSHFPTGQIFGFTERAIPPANEYVCFLAVRDTEQGNFVFALRGADGKGVELEIPTDDAVELALALLLRVRQRDQMDNNLPVTQEKLP